ncbi:MAG: hypothetical protein ACRDJH_25125 [Thermomicrobiales bacterium]
MVATVEERLALLEARVNRLEECLNRPEDSKIGLTIEEAKERVKTPADRGPEEFEQLRRFLGSAEGPEDLSERKHEYLYGSRD